MLVDGFIKLCTLELRLYCNREIFTFHRTERKFFLLIAQLNFYFSLLRAALSEPLNFDIHLMKSQLNLIVAE